MAVVDSHARVFGVSGVRVVDASTFPFLPPGHPQSTVCESSSFSGLESGWMSADYDRCTCGEDRGSDQEWAVRARVRFGFQKLMRAGMLEGWRFRK